MSDPPPSPPAAPGPPAGAGSLTGAAALALTAGAAGLALRSAFVAGAYAPAIQVTQGTPTARALSVLTLLAVVISALAFVAQLRWLQALRRAGRRPAWGLLPWRVACVVAVGGAAVFVARVARFEVLWFRIAIGLAGGVYCAWVLVWRLSAGRLPIAVRRVLRVVDFTAFQLALAVCALEVGLTLVARSSTSPIFARDTEDPAAKVRRNRYRPGTVRRAFVHDERGFYDRRPAPVGERPTGGRLVVTIGDSFSNGIVPQAFHYTTVAEGRLERTDVYNVGVNGVGLPEYRWLLVNEVLPLEPDLVVVGLFVGNDVGGARVYDVARSPWARVLDRRFLYVCTVPARWRRVAEERARRGDGARAGEVQGETSDVPLTDDPAELEAAFPWVADPRLEEPTFSQSAFLELERKRARQVAGTDPAVRLRFELEMADLLAAAGPAPVAVLVIPDEFQVEDALWDAVTAKGPPLERDRPQSWMLPWLEERGVPYEDLRPRLLAVESTADGRRAVYHLQDSHFNRRGNAVAGEGLAALIARTLAQ